MKIFFPDIHPSLTSSFAKAFSELGYTLVLPSEDYKITFRPPNDPFVWDEKWNEERVKSELSFANVILVDNQSLYEVIPDVIFVSAYENQFEVLNVIYPRLQKRSKLAFFSGNDYWRGAYPTREIKNYLCADFYGHELAKSEGINHLYYRPWIDYDQFTFEGVSDSNIIGVYIGRYAELFPEQYRESKVLAQMTPFANHIFHTESPKSETAKTMAESSATLHIKPAEGYGYAIAESMARGRPVFLSRNLSNKRSFLQWAHEGESAFFIDSVDEYKEKLTKLLEDKELRHTVQSRAASLIREKINNEEQTEALRVFLETLV